MRKSMCLIIVWLAVIYPLAAKSQSPVNYEELDNYIRNAFKDHDFTGMTISIVKDGSVVFSQAYGLRNAKAEEAMTTGSLFNIASCTKAFSAACLGILVDEGKLKWEDKVIDYMPEFRLADPYITNELNMIDLLSHRCGLGTFYGDLLWYETDYDNKEIIKRMRYLPITNDFRSEFGYQNNMYMISGEIVKKITGKTWSEFVYERIFKPLEMVESKTCSEHLAQDQNIAYPHLKYKTQQLYMSDPDPAGTIYSSVDEMSHWITMLLNNGQWKEQRVLSPNVIEELFTPRTLLELIPFQKENGIHFSAYGLGWFMYDYSGKKVIEHSGGMPGFLSRVTLVPEERLGMVILTNDSNYLRNAVRMKILNLFLNDSDKDWSAEFLEMKKKHEAAAEERKAERKAKRAKESKPSLTLAEYTGSYEDKMYGPARIELVDSELWLTLLPTKEVFVSKMEHWHYDTFRIKFRDEFLPEGFITFSFDSNGEVIGFKIDLPNPDFHFFNLDFKKQDNSVKQKKE